MRYLVNRKGLGKILGIFLVVVGLSTAVFITRQQQDVRQRAASVSGDVIVDFSNRQNTSHPINSHFAGMNGFNKIQSNSQILSYLAPSHFDLMRVSVDMIATFPSATQQSWSAFDGMMSNIASQNLHPILTIGYTPTWLQPNPNPCSLNSSHVAPTNVQQWGQLAAMVVAHMDKTFPSVHPEYEIWNEPDGTTFMCVSASDPNPDQTRLSEYKQIYGAAAPLMKQQAQKDGVQIHIGGPALAVPKARAALWFPALVSDPQIAPYLDFITFHDYQNGGAVGDNWTTFLAGTRNATTGQAAIFEQISAYVRKGTQPNPSQTPIYDDEYNTNTGLPNSARNDPTYAPLWNSLIIADLLNTVNDTTSPYGAAQQAPAGFAYFVSTQPPPGNEFCLFGTWNSAMDCTAGNQPYPQYYAYQLFTDPRYLDITNHGYVATAATTTKAGLVVTGFYTQTKDNLVIVNTGSTAYTNLAVTIQNPGTTSPTTATILTLNQANAQIGKSQISIQPMGTDYTGLVTVPAYSTVAVSITASGGSGGTGTPVPSNTPRPTSSISVTPANTATPTLRVTQGITSTPFPSLTVTVTQGVTSTPFPSPNPNNTLFSFAVCPHGLGKCGDNANPNNGGNSNPHTMVRIVTVAVYDATNKSVTTNTGTVRYNPGDLNFFGTVDMGKLATGNYIVSVKMDGFLSQQFSGVQTITALKTNVLTPPPSLVTGDINNDNQIDIQDYNILISCFGSKQQTSSCINPAASDVNDDGVVDAVDYNLFIRELSVQHGG